MRKSFFVMILIVAGSLWAEEKTVEIEYFSNGKNIRLEVSSVYVTRGEFESFFGPPFTGEPLPDDYVLTEELAGMIITDISWGGAISFCNKLSESKNLEPFYVKKENNYDPINVEVNFQANGYRLLTEKEWLILIDDHGHEIGNRGEGFKEFLWDDFTGEVIEEPYSNTSNYNRLLRDIDDLVFRRGAPAYDRHGYSPETTFRVARRIN